jgi:hypothetical protein
MAIDETLLKLEESLEAIESRLSALNAVPSTAVQTAQAMPDDSGRKHLTAEEMYSLRKELKQKSTADLHFMFTKQAQRNDTGIPFELWLRAGGASVETAIAGNPDLVKLLDTGAVAPLIRQDLEPLLYALFVKQFPTWDRIAKEPANGLVHAYNQNTSYGDAQFMTELGTVTDDVSAFVRQTTNVSVIATRRGISLKSQFAVQAGGMGYNPEQVELTNGLRAIAHKMQKTIFQGQATDSGGTAANELGLYDANGFNGLRSILNQAKAKNVDPTAGTPEDMRAALDRAAVEIMDLGGQPSIIYARATDKTTFDLQQDQNVRYMATTVEVTPGILTNAVNTVFGPLPILAVPGDSIGTYTATSTYSGYTVADMYMLDESTISLPYLGSDAPTVLEIPTGINGQLTKLFIIFGMWGLACKAVPFSNKVRVRQAS